MGEYETAQICLNGHIITREAEGEPERLTPHCTKCGQPTITACPDCKTPILGRYFSPSDGYLYVDNGIPPAFCHACGHPYPWTERSLQAAKERIDDELTNLSETDRQELKSSLDDLVTDSPRTELVATRFKRILTKLGPPAVKVIEAIVANLITEAARRIVFPTP